MNTAHLASVLARRPFLTRKDLALRWCVSLRTFDYLRARDPRFPRPIRIAGQRWTPEQIAAYERTRTSR